MAHVDAQSPLLTGHTQSQHDTSTSAEVDFTDRDVVEVERRFFWGLDNELKGASVLRSQAASAQAFG